jgi:signal transduction histidine kinase
VKLSRHAESLLDSPPEPPFDTLTALASRILGAPVSLISLLDNHRQFFKSQCGLPEPLASRRETPLTHSFCQHVASSGEPLVIPDARLDSRVENNPAIRDNGVIAYLGVPLFDGAGAAYGALCVICGEPRAWSERDVEIIQALAEQVMNEVNMRARMAEQHHKIAALEHAEQRWTSAAAADQHDLRTPLNALILTLQEIRAIGGLSEDQAFCLDLAERNGKALADMVDKMLDIGGIDARGATALTIRDTLPLELVARAIEQVAPLASAKRQTLKSSTDTILAVPADADKILRVLVNLLGNAIKFTPEGGTVIISVADYVDDGRSAVVFTVRDSGIGIGDADIDQLFREGFRVDSGAPTRRSTGIGLTFCKKVIEAHRGKIWCESELGEGSIFSFTLPAPC